MRMMPASIGLLCLTCVGFSWSRMRSRRCRQLIHGHVHYRFYRWRHMVMFMKGSSISGTCRQWHALIHSIAACARCDIPCTQQALSSIAANVGMLCAHLQHSGLRALRYALRDRFYHHGIYQQCPAFIRITTPWICCDIPPHHAACISPDA